MTLLWIAAKTGVYVLMGLCVLAALAAVTLRNIFHAALSLAAALILIAGIFIALQAEFLAVVQVLLYVGAVMTLIIFAIMLTEGIEDKTFRQQNRLSIPALAGISVFLALLIRLILKTSWPINPSTLQARVGVFDLGKALMGHYVFPFEFISVVLVVALVGAILIARRD